MTLENIYYISQTVAVAVIIATLVAILFQGYQTNKIARADLTLSMWMQTGQMQYSLFDSPEKAKFMHRAMFEPSPLSEAEKLRFNSALGLGIGVHEAAFNLRVRNLVEKAAYDRNTDTTRAYLSSPRVRKWWKIHRMMGFDPGFRAIVDAITAEFDAPSANAEEKRN